MKIGFLTACLPQTPLADIAAWAAAQGFQALELAAWPYDATRDYQAHHVRADQFTRDDAARMREMLDGHGLEISALAYYDNNLHPNKQQRQDHLNHLRHVIDAAAMLGCDRVGTFVGGRPAQPQLIMKEVGEIFREIVAYAEDQGVRIMIENCPMENWVQFGLPGNYAWSPELWDALFEEVPSPNFGLNFDPSHLYWLGIDYLQATRDYGPRIFHAHAKDAEILPAGKQRYSVLGEQLTDNVWSSGWWRYRMPGKGEIDWKAFIAALREVGYDDTLSIEHEDPAYEGTVEKIQEGLRLGQQYLTRLV